MPPKIKTKGIYFGGVKNGARVNYPDEVILNGEELPWVVTGDHLGQDARVRRALYIDRSVVWDSSYL